MNRLLCAVCFILMAGVLPGRAADSPLAAFRAANTLYEKGQYAEAAAAYETLAAGHTSAALAYNLGNAYYRQGRIGKAVLQYERAHRLAPRDRDIRENLEFARQQMKEPQPAFTAALRDGIAGLAGLNELAVLCSFFSVIFFGTFAAGLLVRRRRIALVAVVAFLGLLLSGAWLLLKLDAEVWTATGIVVAGPAEVRNGPGAENSVGFTLPEGRKVLLLGASGDWTAVGLPAEGLRGWIEKKFVEPL
jgi:tetratricopeptide (TPR) repeat protein